jgi:hypothetical protein
MTLAKRVTRLLSRATGQRYAFRPEALPRVGAMVEEAALGPHAVEDLGSLLKLVFVLRSKHRSFAAARQLVGILRRSNRARRIIATHWSVGRRARRNADLTATRTELAPHLEAKAPPGSTKVLAFLTPGQELRGRRLATIGGGKKP